jgi:hypothetical protein
MLYNLYRVFVLFSILALIVPRPGAKRRPRGGKPPRPIHEPDDCGSAGIQVQGMNPLAGYGVESPIVSAVGMLSP